MRRALRLARRGLGSVEPNPMVGCVLVRNGRIIGEGYHHRFGGPHAEVFALRNVRGNARGATAYVTLEPCCHFGKTPPCTNALIAAGVKRVVAALQDPFPKVHGRGEQLLREAGITVQMGLLRDEAIVLAAPYLKLQCLKQPWVILKWAQSIDGKIATRTGDSQWISGEASRRMVHQVRGRIDGIIVGVGTAIADDPALTCRGVKAHRTATRIVIDPRLRIPLDAQLVRTAKKTPTLVVAREGDAPSRRVRELERRGVTVLHVRGSKKEIDLAAILRSLGERGMANVMVEGGGVTAGAFYDAGLADEAMVFVSPRLIGGAGAPGPLGGVGPARMEALPVIHSSSLRRVGDDLLYQLRFSEPAAWLAKP